MIKNNNSILLFKIINKMTKKNKIKIYQILLKNMSLFPNNKKIVNFCNNIKAI